MPTHLYIFLQVHWDITPSFILLYSKLVKSKPLDYRKQLLSEGFVILDVSVKLDSLLERANSTIDFFKSIKLSSYLLSCQFPTPEEAQAIATNDGLLKVSKIMNVRGAEILRKHFLRSIESSVSKQDLLRKLDASQQAAQAWMQILDRMLAAHTGVSENLDPFESALTENEQLWIVLAKQIVSTGLILSYSEDIDDSPSALPPANILQFSKVACADTAWDWCRRLCTTQTKRCTDLLKCMGQSLKTIYCSTSSSGLLQPVIPDSLVRIVADLVFAAVGKSSSGSALVSGLESCLWALYACTFTKDNNSVCFTRLLSAFEKLASRLSPNTLANPESTAFIQILIQKPQGLSLLSNPGVRRVADAVLPQFLSKNEDQAEATITHFAQSLHSLSTNLPPRSLQDTNALHGVIILFAISFPSCTFLFNGLVVE